MRKFRLFALFVFILAMGVSPFAKAAPVNSINSANSADLYFFWRVGCPHCEQEQEFLAKLRKKYPQLRVHDFEIRNNEANRDLLMEIGKKLNQNISGVPFTVIGTQYITGYSDDAITGAGD